MTKILTTLFAFGLFAFATNDAHAYFKVCNKRSDMIWVSYAHYLARTNEVIGECGKTFGGGCAFSAWEVRGWWTVQPNQCATVLDGSIKNRFS